jgi:alkyldihydroxyacetonephosphate synthase
MKEAMQSKKINVMAHWSHFYLEGGSMYLIFVMLEKDTENEPKASNLFKETWAKGLNACIENGGSISHHHGIGIFRGGYMEQELGPGIYDLLKGIKNYLDPNGIMNPGKLGL